MVYEREIRNESVDVFGDGDVAREEEPDPFEELQASGEGVEKWSTEDVVPRFRRRLEA